VKKLPQSMQTAPPPLQRRAAIKQRWDRILEIVIEAEALRAEIKGHMRRLSGAKARWSASLNRPRRMQLFAKDCEIEMLIQQHRAAVRVLESSTGRTSRRPRDWLWSSGGARFGWQNGAAVSRVGEQSRFGEIGRAELAALDRVRESIGQ
jgi:hypothetical protein